jgi:hypothetical protein
MRIIKKTTGKIKNKIKEKYKIKSYEKTILKNQEKIIAQRLKDYMRKYSLYLSSNPRINPQPQLNMEVAAKELTETIKRYNNYRIKYGLSPVNYQNKIKGK